MFVTDLQQVQYLDKYARWNPAEQRRETWDETCTRVLNFFKRQPQLAAITPEEWAELDAALRAGEALPSMRIIQMAGPALDRCNVGAYNCSFLALDSWQAFAELLYILMQGTGVGFSVERVHVDKLPAITHQTGMKYRHRIEDTTEGWCNALVIGLECWAHGDDVEYDYSDIRPYGTPLQTKGGRASGPQPLKNLLDFSRKLLLKHQGRKLSPLNAHDLACYCGSIVQVGGVRRAAEISLSDRDDAAMRHAKSGPFWEQTPERAMANNSAVYTQKPDLRTFLDEWLALWDSGTGERGIFNRAGLLHQMPLTRQYRDDLGTNPCGEIILRPKEFCNLSIAVARPSDGPTELRRKVRLAALWGTLQATLTKFTYLSKEWKANCEEERLLGVDITGQQDNPFLRWHPDPALRTYRHHLMHELASVVREVNTSVAGRLGINAAAATTCVKPSGNSSQLLDCSSGLHPRYAPFYVRRLRIGSSSPVAKLLRNAGVPHFPEVGQDPTNPTVWVFEFPVAAPPGAVTRGDMSAIDQLNNWLDWKRNYTDHNPSCTIYVAPHEWLEVGAFVYKHWEHIGGISFLPLDGGIYQLAPYEEITEDEYNKRVAAWPEIDFSKLDEQVDTTEVNREFSCTGDRCEL